MAAGKTVGAEKSDLHLKAHSRLWLGLSKRFPVRFLALCMVVFALVYSVTSCGQGGRKPGGPDIYRDRASEGQAGSRRSTDGANALRLVMPAGSYSFDPAIANKREERTLIGQVYEGLTFFNPAGQVSGQQAETFNSPDGGRTWVFNLRPDLKWSDGSSLTADDFRRTWLDRLKPEASSGAGLSAYQLRRFFCIEGAEAYHQEQLTADEVGIEAEGLTLTVRLRQPFERFPGWVSHMLFFPSKVTEAGETLYNGPYVPRVTAEEQAGVEGKAGAEEQAVKENRSDQVRRADTGNPVGQVSPATAANPGGQTPAAAAADPDGPTLPGVAAKKAGKIILEANRAYWDVANTGLKTIEVHLEKDPFAAYEMFVRGDVDLFGAPFYEIPLQRRESAAGRPDRLNYLTTDIDFIKVESADPLFYDPAIIQAMDAVLDVQSLPNTILFDNSEPLLDRQKPNHEQKTTARETFADALERLGIERLKKEGYLAVSDPDTIHYRLLVSNIKEWFGYFSLKTKITTEDKLKEGDRADFTYGYMAGGTDNPLDAFRLLLDQEGALGFSDAEIVQAIRSDQPFYPLLQRSYMILLSPYLEGFSVALNGDVFLRNIRFR